MNQLTPYEGNPLGDDADHAQQVTINQQMPAEVAKIAAMMRAPIIRERDLPTVMRRLREIAAIDGDALYYEFPVKNKKANRIDKIIGPSVKLAYAMVTAYGNCGTTCEVVETDDAWIFNATFVDRESGSINSRLYRQRKSQSTFKKKDGSEDDRALDIAFQIGQSKAIRNIVVNSLRSLADASVEAAKEAIVTKIAKQPAAYRDKCVARLADYGIPLDAVSAWIGAGPKQWKPPEIARVVSALQGITDGVTNSEELGWTEKPVAPPAPPPPGAAPEPEAKTPAKKQAKPDEPPEDAAAFVPWLVAKFTEAADTAALDLMWERFEKTITAAAPDAQATMTQAYDDRRQVLEAAE